jgi:hypothetical protein
MFAAGLIVFGLGAGVARVAREPSPPRPTPPIYAADRDAIPGQKNTQVEPASFAWGSKIVITFQAWRIADGGAGELGWETSADGGVHWRAGTLPLNGYDAASDTVVTFDATHHVWLISALGLRGADDYVFVSRSTNGLQWSTPVVAAGDAAEEYDKDWIWCDNGARSPYRGRCYLAYVDTATWLLGIRTSDDGGKTWSQPQHLVTGIAGGVFSGPVPVTRPNGDLVVPYSFFAPLAPAGGRQPEDRIGAVVSHDGGASFTPPIRVAQLEVADESPDIRAPTLPSATVDAAGKLYVAWQDGRFREYTDNDIVFSTSADGTSWSEPARLPLARDAAYFVPAIAVDPATSGRKAHLAVVYYSHRPTRGCATYLPGCFEQIDAWMIQSFDGGRTWGKPLRLDKQPMRVDWLAETAIGGMLGDYISVSFVRGKPVAVVALAGPPSRAGHNEAIFACRSPTACLRPS